MPQMVSSKNDLCLEILKKRYDVVGGIRHVAIPTKNRPQRSRFSKICVAQVIHPILRWLRQPSPVPVPVPPERRPRIADVSSCLFLHP